MNKNYNGQAFAKDIASFNAWAKKEVPGMLTLGPGAVIEGLPGVSLAIPGMHMLSTDSMMSAAPKPVFDAFSYHYYGAVSSA